MNSITPAQVAAGEFPNCEAVTVRIVNGEVRVEMHMTDDNCAVPFANVVQAMPEIVEKLRAEIHAAGGKLYLPLCAAHYLDDYGESETDEMLVVVECGARGGSRH